jgi:FAD/FMN-containing dehydrogenase
MYSFSSSYFSYDGAENDQLADEKLEQQIKGMKSAHERIFTGKKAQGWALASIDGDLLANVWGSNLDKMIQLKAKYDPNNTFARGFSVANAS